MTDETSPRRDAANGVRVPHADGRNGAGAYPSDPPTLLRASERADGGWLSGACTDLDGAIEAVPRIEDADADWAMIAPDGSRFFPDSEEDAAYFAEHHDARPEHPDRWPWRADLADEIEADLRRVTTAADPPPAVAARPLIAISEHRCVQDDGTEVDDEWTMCSGGILYGPCEYPTCGGTCQIIGDCECNCHAPAVRHG